MSHVSTRVVINGISFSTKPDSRIAGITFVKFIISQNTDSCPGTLFQSRYGIESFLVTAELQGDLRANQRLPRVTTQWGAAVLPISDQRVQGVRLLVDDNKLDLLADFHTEADFRERCFPVRWYFRLLAVKPSLSAVEVKSFFVAPESGCVAKSLLLKKKSSDH